MTNLTEQLKKGELIDGFHYVCSDWSDEVEIRYVHNGVDDWREIIAPVPSYEELQNQAFILKSRESEIVKLKELLKECVEYVKKDYGDYLTYTRSAIYQEINQVLGEE